MQPDSDSYVFWCVSEFTSNAFRRKRSICTFLWPFWQPTPFFRFGSHSGSETMLVGSFFFVMVEMSFSSF